MIQTVLDHQLNIQHVFDILPPPHPKLKKKNHEEKTEKPWSHGWEEKEGEKKLSELESCQSVF